MKRSLIGRDDLLNLIQGDDIADMLAVSGRYEIMGDDDLAVPGHNAVSLNQSQRDNVAERIMARNAKLLRDVPPTASRTFPIGFVSDGTILPGDSATIVSRPQIIFRGERLVVPSDLAGDFTIDDFKVGKDSQFVSEGPIPARALQENAWGVYFQLDTAQISQNLVISVTNISGAARTFRAMLIGSAVE